ncbi:MAG: DUF5106 domain-containing protein [Tannerella sp.]|jgi:thiol-disulfide isomerase/thioredoxin|nr:DUF5106 domain-containing protein [Tannerella sp.]
MKHPVPLLVFALLSLGVFGCSGQAGNKPVKAAVAQSAHKFKMIDIPKVYTTPEERAKYLVTHYWDNFNFSDTTAANLSESTESALVDYIDVLPYTTEDVAFASIKTMLGKAEAADSVYFYFLDMYEKYLHDPNSPMRNEEYYIPVLEQAMDSPLVKEKTRTAALLALAQKNRLGHAATDFSYLTADGREGRLYGLKSPYTILFFYNPDCEHCREVIGQMMGSSDLEAMLHSKRLALLAVDAENDFAAWKEHLSAMGKDWTVAYDKKQRILSDEVYDLKASPTIYLLDKDKKVLLKDTSFERLMSYLKEHISENTFSKDGGSPKTVKQG